MSRVTAQDLAFADVLIDALDAHLPVKVPADLAKVRRKTIATLLADYREVILSCAIVRVEREFAVKARKKS